MLTLCCILAHELLALSCCLLPVDPWTIGALCGIDSLQTHCMAAAWQARACLTTAAEATATDQTVAF